MVLGSLFMHRDSVVRRRWKDDDEPRREFEGFPMRTFLLIPPPAACSVWWYSYRFKVSVPTPEGWGRIGENDGVMCGWIAVAGWVLVLLAIWWDGYVASKLRCNSCRANKTASSADVDANADANAKGKEIRTAVGNRSQSKKAQ